LPANHFYGIFDTSVGKRRKYCILCWYFFHKNSSLYVIVM